MCVAWMHDGIRRMQCYKQLVKEKKKTFRIPLFFLAHILFCCILFFRAVKGTDDDFPFEAATVNGGYIDIYTPNRKNEKKKKTTNRWRKAVAAKRKCMFPTYIRYFLTWFFCVFVLFPHTNKVKESHTHTYTGYIHRSVEAWCTLWCETMAETIITCKHPVFNVIPIKKKKIRHGWCVHISMTTLLSMFGVLVWRVTKRQYEQPELVNQVNNKRGKHI